MLSSKRSHLLTSEKVISGTLLENVSDDIDANNANDADDQLIAGTLLENVSDHIYANNANNAHDQLTSVTLSAKLFVRRVSAWH